MSVNYWRDVEYTDDGCSIYQCLSCYNKWESRTAPAHETFKCGECKYCVSGVYDYSSWNCYGKREHAVYIPTFVYCPYCATKWQGQIHRPENHRKSIIQKLMDNEPYEIRDERYRKSQLGKIWEIQKCTPNNPNRNNWESYRYYRKDKTAKEIYEVLKGLREAEERDILESTHQHTYYIEDEDRDKETAQWFAEISKRNKRVFRARLVGQSPKNSFISFSY